MRAGKLSTRVTLQYDEATENDVDEHGEPVPDWQDQDDWWAEVVPVKGDEVFRAGQVAAGSVYAIHLRIYPNLTPVKWRIYDGTTYYYPVYVTHDSTETIARCKVSE